MNSPGLTGLKKRLQQLERRLGMVVDVWEQAIDEAQSELQAETARLPEIWSTLEAGSALADHVLKEGGSR
jgi:hypothetical protein